LLSQREPHTISGSPPVEDSSTHGGGSSQSQSPVEHSSTHGGSSSQSQPPVEHSSTRGGSLSQSQPPVEHSSTRDGSSNQSQRPVEYSSTRDWSSSQSQPPVEHSSTRGGSSSQSQPPVEHTSTHGGSSSGSQPPVEHCSTHGGSLRRHSATSGATIDTEIGDNAVPNNQWRVLRRRTGVCGHPQTSAERGSTGWDEKTDLSHLRSMMKHDMGDQQRVGAHGGSGLGAQGVQPGAGGQFVVGMVATRESWTGEVGR